MQKSNYFIILIYIVLLSAFFLNSDPNGGAYKDYQNHLIVINDFKENFFDTLFNYDKYSTRHSPVLYGILSFFYSLEISDKFIRLIFLHIGILLPFIFYKCLKLKFPSINEDQIVLLDSFYLNPSIVDFGESPDKSKIEKHYYFLNKIINNLSTMYKKKIVVCVHPKDNLELKKKYFPNLDVVQYETRKNIYKAFLVLFIETSAIVDAILLKKRILTLFSNFFSKTINNFGQGFAARAGLLQINIENELKTDKNMFLSKLDEAKDNYSNYVKSYIAPDGNNIGYEKIIKILKERFFKTVN